MKFLYGKQDLRDISRAQEYCFLMTNGLGGYVSMNAAASVSRCDQGLLVAAVKAPNERVTMVHRLRETLTVGERKVDLSTQQFADNTPEEHGWQFLQSFSFAYVPRWEYQVGDVHHRIRPDLFRAGAQKYNEADLAALLQDPERPIFIAEIDGKVAGYCFCIFQITEGNPVLCDRKALYIDDLCVDEAARGKGIATALFRHVTAVAKAEGAAFITLNVWCGNDSAMAFYQSRGMKPRKIYMETSLEETC